MVLIQLTATYNDIFNIPPLTSNVTVVTGVPVGSVAVAGSISQNNPPTLLFNVNLDRGIYKAKIVGIKIACGFPETASGVLLNRSNPMLFGLQGTSFRFPLSSDSTFWFAGSSQYTLGDYSGDKEFIIDNPTGQMDITLRVIMFGSHSGESQQAVPIYNTNNLTWSWRDTNFAYLMLTLDVEPMDLPQNDHMYSRRAGFF